MRNGCNLPPCIRRDTISNPLSMRRRPVSQFQWSLPMQRVVTGTNASYTHAATFPCARTCSRSNKLPPGLSTRPISCRPCSGSRTEHKTRVTTTLSKEASENGNLSTAARVSVMGMGASPRVPSAQTNIASSGSMASTCTTRLRSQKGKFWHHQHHAMRQANDLARASDRTVVESGDAASCGCKKRQNAGKRFLSSQVKDVPHYSLDHSFSLPSPSVLAFGKHLAARSRQ
jgi:hypothetical protein